MDVRVGARYRLEFAHGDAHSVFFGTYKESNTALVLCLATQRGKVTRVLVTTVTFAEKGGKTFCLVMHELYPSEGSSSTPPAPGGGVMRWSRRSSNWTSFSSPWARAWDGHEVVDLGRLPGSLHAEENPDQVVAADICNMAVKLACSNKDFANIGRSLV